MFYQGGPIDNFTHVSVPVAQSSSDSESKAACTAGMALSQFRMINNELLKYICGYRTSTSNYIGKSISYMYG